MGKTPKRSLGDRIRQRLKALGKDATGVSRAAGFSDDLLRNVFKAEKAGRKPQLRGDALHAVARELDTTALWLLLEEGPEDIDEPPVGFDAPHIADYKPSVEGGMPLIDARAGAGGGGISEDRVRDEIILPARVKTTLTSADTRRIHWLEIRGESMFPTLWQGDLVGINIGDTSMIEGGLFAIQEVDTAEIVVKRVDFAEGDKQFIRIISDNPKHPDRRESSANVRVIGRVVARIGKVV